MARERSLTLRMVDACKNSDLAAVKDLLKQGANVHGVDDGKLRLNPVRIAVWKGSPEILRLLLAKGARSEGGFCFNTLRRTAPEVLEILLADKESNLNRVDCRKKSSLLDYAVAKKIKAAEEILRRLGALSYSEIEAQFWRKDASRFRIPIVEGHDPSDCFWICPVKDETNKYGEHAWIHEEEISIQEDIVRCYLHYFFKKKEFFKGNFEWWLTENYYEMDVFERLLDDIRKTMDKLRKNPHDESLRDLWGNFDFFHMINSDMNDFQMFWEFSDGERRRLLEFHSYAIFDFYARFVRRMETMIRRGRKMGSHAVTVYGP